MPTMVSEIHPPRATTAYTSATRGPDTTSAASARPRPVAGRTKAGPVSVKRRPPSRAGRPRPCPLPIPPGARGSSAPAPPPAPGRRGGRAAPPTRPPHDRGHADPEAPQLDPRDPGPRRRCEEEHRVDSRRHAEDHWRDPSQKRQVNVGMQRGEELVGQERTEM